MSVFLVFLIFIPLSTFIFLLSALSYFSSCIHIIISLLSYPDPLTPERSWGSPTWIVTYEQFVAAVSKEQLLRK